MYSNIPLSICGNASHISFLYVQCFLCGFVLHEQVSVCICKWVVDVCLFHAFLCLSLNMFWYEGGCVCVDFVIECVQMICVSRAVCVCMFVHLCGVWACTCLCICLCSRTHASQCMRVCVFVTIKIVTWFKLMFHENCRQQFNYGLYREKQSQVEREQPVISTFIINHFSFPKPNAMFTSDKENPAAESELCQSEEHGRNVWLIRASLLCISSTFPSFNILYHLGW